MASLIASTLRLSVPLYLSTVLLGLAPTAIGMLGLASVAGDRPWRGDLLAPGWMNLGAEIFMSAAYTRDAGGLAVMLLAALVILPLALLGQLVAYSFLAGGTLQSLRGEGASSSFWAGCRRWFWPFLRLSLLGGVLAIMAAVGGSALAGVVTGGIGPEVGAVLQFVVQAIILGWLELARASMVVESDESVGNALRRAARVAARPLALVVWLLIALPGAGLLVASVLPPTINDPYAVSELLRALVFGQALAFLGAWTKVLRLAFAMRMALRYRPQERQRMSATAGPHQSSEWAS